MAIMKQILVQYTIENHYVKYWSTN